MLGSVTEAEDIVQEAFLRYHRVVSGSGEPDSPKAGPGERAVRRGVPGQRPQQSVDDANAG
jgi:hypothetical protein